MRAIRAGLGDEAYGAIRGTSDSEHLFAIFLDEYLAEGDLEGALRATLARADEARAGQRALLSLVVSDGTKVCAVTEAFDGNAPTLYQRRQGDGTLFASEPLFGSEGWETLEAGEVVTAS